MTDSEILLNKKGRRHHEEGGCPRYVTSALDIFQSTLI